MARTKAAATAVEGSKFKFTRERVDSAHCPAGKSQALYWDTKQPGLGLRVTANDARSFIYESRLGRQTVRMTIGPASMPIRAARSPSGEPLTAGADAEAARLAALVAQGIDPRAAKAEAMARQAADRDAAKAARARLELGALDAWAVYCAERSEHWGERSQAEHLRMADPGGVARKRAPGKVTVPGMLHALLNRPLAALDAEAVEEWVRRETKARPASVALAGC